MRIVKSMKFELEDICKLSDLVLVDTCTLTNNSAFLDEVYDCKNVLDFDVERLNSEIEFIASLFSSIRPYDNLFTVQGVVQEKIDHLDLLHKTAKFHRARLNPRTNRRYSRRRAKMDMNRKEYKEHQIERAHEGYLIDTINIYADLVLRWVNYLDERIIPIKNQDLFKQIVEDVSERKLKINFNFRHNCYGKKKEDKKESTTDESLAMAAYEEGLKQKNVSIVSNDSDLTRILNFCSYKNYLNIPNTAHISVYSRFRKEKYQLMFDSTFSLWTPKPKEVIPFSLQSSAYSNRTR